MKQFLRDYSLSVVLAILFVVSLSGQFIFQTIEVADNAKQHGESFSWEEFWPQFGSATLENWQSEFLQLLAMAILTSFLIHKGSAESKDSDDKMQASLERIEKRLASLEAKPKS